MTPTSNEQAAHEIGKLKQELENLEHAYATFEMGVRWAQKAFFVYIAALVMLTVWSLVTGKPGFAAILLIFLIATVGYTFKRVGSTFKLDVVKLYSPVFKHDLEEIENQIAHRKARLAVLHRERSGDAGEVGVGKVVGLIPPPSSTGTFGHSGYGGLLHRIGNDPLLIIITTIIVGLLGFLLVQKYNDCMERGGKACPLYCDKGKCRLPYGAPEPLSKEPPAGPTRSSGAGL